MSRDRTRTRERTADEESATTLDVDREEGPAAAVETDRATGQDVGTTADAGRRASARTRLSLLFSPRAFLAALLATVVGLVAGTALIPVPGAGVVGLLLGTFVFGLVAERRRYLESTLAGGAAFGAAAVLQYAVVAALGGFGVPLAVVAGGLGAVGGVVGHYFGRDLRDGLTREL